MFQKNAFENRIPPNFLNSILTNESLYKMFRDEFVLNSEYFNNIDKECYLEEILEFIINLLYNKDAKINENELKYIKSFYNDFILPIIKEDKSALYKSNFFKALNYAHTINSADDFNQLYDFIMETSDYENVNRELLSEFVSLMREDSLSISEYESLTNYIKYNIDNVIPMDLVSVLLKGHIYKTNHIFDREVVKKILYSISYDFLLPYGICPNFEYVDGISFSKDKSTHDIENKIIYIDSIMIDTFISGNYVELLNNLLYKLLLYRDDLIVHGDYISMDALHTIWRMTILKVDLDRIFTEPKYQPHAYLSDMESTSFVMTLRFLETIGVSLHFSYINSHITKVDFDECVESLSKKEISEEMQFVNKLFKTEMERITALRNRYKVLQLFYLEDGKRKKAIDLLKIAKKENENVIFEYLHSTIPEPKDLIDDVIDLSGRKFNDEKIDDFVERLVKYIYLDTFYYSVDNHLKLNDGKMTFDREEYLSGLYVRISCIKDTPMTHRFIDNALKIIESVNKTT